MRRRAALDTPPGTPLGTLLGTPLLVAVLTAGLLVSGCSGGGASTKHGSDPRKTLASAKRQLDRTSGVRIGLHTNQLPRGVNGLLDATGVGTHPPAFQGTIKVTVGGVNADAAVVAPGRKVYAKLPFTSKFAPIDPGDYGAPDPARLLARRGGLSSMLTSARDVKQRSQVRDGKRVLTRYTATVPGTTISSIIPSASSTASFDAAFTVDDHDRLAKAVLTGPFFPDAKDVTYSVSFADYGLHRQIKAP